MLGSKQRKFLVCFIRNTMKRRTRFRTCGTRIFMYIKIGLKHTKILQFPHKFYEFNIQTTKRSILSHIIVQRDRTYIALR